jgi:glutamate-5-semialdehyde dehydrogenase
VTDRDIIIATAKAARAASRQLAGFTTEQKNLCLRAMADALESQWPAINSANERDVIESTANGLSAAMLDRLRLNEKRIANMADGLRVVANLPDPVGRVLDDRTRPNGLRLRKISTPIGVIVIIYESRPNVTADAAALCFKAGNAVILRGGKEANASNRAIAEILVAAGKKTTAEFPDAAIQMLPVPGREAIKELLGLTQYIDLCMPRGGEGLIRAVTECSKVPVIKHYKGVCHVFVDGQADLAMAERIVLNAKLQRPAVCNAMETLLIDRRLAATFLPEIVRAFLERKVELRVDSDVYLNLHSQFPALKQATPEDWETEYNDCILNLRQVSGVAEAIQHINEHGSAHSDSIVTEDPGTAEQFLQAVDSATVYWNASTRFTDGGEFGMGAEIGISTDKIGARGPMGLEEITSYKWIGYGSGQIRT